MPKVLQALLGVLVLVFAIIGAPHIFSIYRNAQLSNQPDEYRDAVARTDGLNRDARWHEDLDYLYKYLKERHPDPFYRTSEQSFETRVQSLHTQIPNRTDAQLIMEFQRLVAMVKDGHTYTIFDPDTTGFRMVPVRLYWFSDGMYIIDALEPYKSTIGSRIYQIDGRPLEEIYVSLNPYVSAENVYWPQHVIPFRLRSPEILQAQGFIGSADVSSWRLVTTNDEFYTIEASPVPYDEVPEEFFSSAGLIDRSEDAPLYLQNTDENFWLEHLQDTNTLYVQFNTVQRRTQSGESIKGFANRIEQLVDRHEGIRVVIDLRHNSGGDNTTYGPLLDLLTNNERINQEGKLFVIIGRSTFSAAVNFTAELEQNTNAILIGEPTGNSPNQFGDCYELVLPHSGLSICISSRYWVKSSPDDDRTSIRPDVEVPLTYRDYARHIDPVLTVILNNWE